MLPALITDHRQSIKVRRRRPATRQRRSRGGENDIRIPHQLAHLERPFLDRLDRKAHVEVAAFHRSEAAQNVPVSATARRARRCLNSTLCQLSGTAKFYDENTCCFGV